MKITASKIYLPLFFVIVTLQLYLPSFKLNVLLQIAALLFCFAADFQNIRFSVKFIKYLIPLVLLMLLGFIGMLLYRYNAYNIIKDIFHFIKPVVGILLGYVIFKRVNDLNKFARAIIIAGLVSSFIHYFIVFFMVRSLNTIEDIRQFTKDNFLDLFALYLLVCFKQFFGTRGFRNIIINTVAIGLLALSCVLYFSRTMIIIAFILGLTTFGLTRITPKTLRFGLFFIILTGIMFSVLFSVKIGRNKPGIEGFLYKVKNAPAEIFTTRINREDHRDLWDHWRAYEMKRALALMDENKESYVFGTGFGSLVNLKFFAPLTGEQKGIRYISELHNGYIYIVYKTGIAGILIYLFMLSRWYGYIYKRLTLPNMLVSAIGLIYVFSTVTITGIYNTRDIIIFILGGALFYAEAEKKKVPPEIPEA